jgi:hypothetical protein
LPDKAIDIIDEAGSHARLKSAVIPDEIKEIEREVQQLTRDKNEMVRQQEYEKAAKLRDQIGEANQKLADAMSSWRRSQKEARVEIGAEDISRVISDWTGIPLQQLEESENERLIKMHEELAERVVGSEGRDRTDLARSAPGPHRPQIDAQTHRQFCLSRANGRGQDRAGESHSPNSCSAMKRLSSDST